jgi:hypothetical protein
MRVKLNWEVIEMKAFKLKYNDGNFKIVYGKNALEIIKKYDLCNRENVNTIIFELSGEQEAIALSNINS